MNKQPEQLFLKKLILRLKMKEMVKKWKKRVKKSKHRKMVLHQMCTSEKAYINSLKKLKNQFQIPLEKLGVLSEGNFMFVFSNLDPIIGLAEEMLVRLQAVEATWDPHTTIISKPLQELEKYFKLYKDYCKNYIKSSEIILEIEKHPEVSPLLKAFEPSGILDYLVKPTQRPFKYPLLIREYLHDLLKDHRDYKSLQKTKQIYSQLCDQLNDSMEAQTRMKQMIQLGKTFGDSIFESSRQLKSKFTAYHFEVQCKVFVFTDILMIAKILYNDRIEQYMKIDLDGGSYVMKRQNTKNFINRLYICGGQNSIHFVFNNLYERDSAYEILDKIINVRYQNEFYKQQMISKVKMQRQTAMMRFSTKPKYQWIQQKYYKLHLIITVVGAEQRLQKAQEKVTYFVKFQLKKNEDIYQIVTLDIETLKNLEIYLRTLYPKLALPSLDLKNKSIFYDSFKNDFTKFIQFRSQHIESFLNYVLRTPEVSQRPQVVLQKLKIHEFLWQAFNKYSAECGCETCLRTQIMTNLQAYDIELHELERKKSQFCISKAINLSKSIVEFIDKKTAKVATLEHKLLWIQCKMNRINHEFIHRFKFGKIFTFYVYVPSFVEEMKIKITMATSSDTVRNIIQQICKRKGISTTRDLALVLSSPKQQFILDDDEYIWDIEKYLKSQAQSSQRSSFFQNITKSFESHDKPEYKLILRKLYIFDKKVEEDDCQRNLERYQIVLGQFLRRFKSGFVSLNLSDVRVFCALFYGIEEYNSLIYSKTISINEEKIKNYLPKSKWNYITPDFVYKIKQIIQKQVVLWDRVTILYRCIIRQFGDKLGWLTQFFEVQNTQPNSLSGGNQFILLGINFNKVKVIPRNSNAVLLEFKITELNYRVSGESIFIDTENRLYHFCGKNLFFFEKLLRVYQLMFEIG